MGKNSAATVFIGNLDEKVTERVLYEILIQVGHVVDLHIPRDRETNRQKGFAFAEYESEEIANYAVKLFSGLVRLHKKTLKFAISGQDKSSQESNTPVTKETKKRARLDDMTDARDTKVPKFSTPSYTPPVSSPLYNTPVNGQRHLNLSRFHAENIPLNSSRPYNHSYMSTPYSATLGNSLISSGFSNGSYEYGRRAVGVTLNNVRHSAVRQPVPYRFY